MHWLFGPGCKAVERPALLGRLLLSPRLVTTPDARWCISR